ncbi:MAG TPA: MFS transporter [Vicinamibacteria bacterium]|nr:MFS transporter [Vicinamibacteria bacterium]
MPLLERIGLHRPELRAWALYDWANSVFMTTVLQVFQIYFPAVAAAGLSRSEAGSRFALATSLSIAAVALVSPVLGALADVTGRKKPMLALFAGMGVLATAGLYGAGRGEWLLALALFVIANIGVVASIVFYNSLLPHIARPEEVDRVSTAGFALGYVSGGLLLAMNGLWIQWPERFGIASRDAAFQLSFLSAALWWGVFSLPVLLRVPEPPRDPLRGEDAARGALGSALARLRRTLAESRGHKDAILVLVAFLIYNDAIVTIIRLAATFGAEIGVPAPSLILAILLVQFVGIPATFAFGQLAGRFGTRPAIFVALVSYVGIVLFGFRMTTTAEFFVLAGLVGCVMGGAQALSRSLFASMVPKEKSAELFGFFGVFDKFGGVFGSALFGLSLSRTGSSRPAVLAMAAFFLIGGFLLSRVDVDRGRRAVREAAA